MNENGEANMAHLCRAAAAEYATPAVVQAAPAPGGEQLDLLAALRQLAAEQAITQRPHQLEQQQHQHQQQNVNNNSRSNTLSRSPSSNNILSSSSGDRISSNSSNRRGASCRRVSLDIDSFRRAWVRTPLSAGVQVRARGRTAPLAWALVHQ